MIPASSREAIKDISSSKLFSVIMILGVLVSIFSITIIVLIGEGTRKEIIDTLKGFGFGSDSIVVLGTPGKLSGHRLKRPRTITFKDVDDLSRITQVKYLSPHQVKRNFAVSKGNREITTWIIGATPQYPLAMEVDLIEGRFFTDEEMKMLKKVCVLGFKPYKELFPEGNAVGSYVRIKDGLYKVVGVIEEVGHLGRFDVDDRIIVPITVTRKVLFKTEYITSVKIVLYESRKLKETVDQVVKILRRNHKIKKGFPDDFSVITADYVVEFVNRSVRELTHLLLKILLIALFLSGLVIVNVMLAAVSERRREIGIKRAVGATKGDIFLEFLQYSIFISLSGSILGVLTASAVGEILSRFIPIHINYKPFLLSVLFGLFVGSISGVYPAKRACNINPVEVLRR